MRRSRGLLNLAKDSYVIVLNAAQSALEAVRVAVVELHSWHKRLMVTNPAYPMTLLTIGKALIRTVTPSAAVAAAAIALLAALLDTGNHRPDYDWDEDYY